MARPKAPVRSASPVTREFFSLLSDTGITEAHVARVSGMSHTTLYDWRVGTVDASIFRLETALQVLGFELVIRPKKQEPEGIQT